VVSELLFLAHLAESYESLWYGATSVVHPSVRQASTFPFKQLLKNQLANFKQTW